MPNACKEQSCEERLRRKDHYLCRTHWDKAEAGGLDECPECGVYKDSDYDRCIMCNKKNRARSTEKKPAASGSRETSRRYDSRKAETFSERAALLEEDPKAQDKRLLFTEQGRKCVYCGNEYRYDELEIEHMIPKSLGGPDNIRNCQLACSTCNKAKGMMTDIEFRKSHAEYLPQKERTPADPPIDPGLFSAPKQKRRRFFRTQR